MRRGERLGGTYHFRDDVHIEFITEINGIDIIALKIQYKGADKTGQK